MGPTDALEIGREAVFVAIKIASPILLVALVVGLVIALVQALTQIQELTLSFVPKILVIFLSVMLFLPYMLSTLTNFAQRLMERIVTLG
ncbi:MAG: flagellar biosynthesis protein FliQ [Alphaproteobacteria bacterium]|jgi:flagellar biosynthetic protein FliQ